MADKATTTFMRWQTIRDTQRAGMSPADAAAVEAGRKQGRAEITAAVALGDLVEQRHQMNVTQTQLAEALGVTKARVSSLERQGDMRISTLRDYVEALGGHLEIDAVFGEDRIHLGASDAV